MTVFEMIEAQQKGKENTPAWMVGEQLKDICRAEPASAQLVEEDLKNPDMSIDACEKDIKEYADANRGKDSCVCVPPQVAEDIIRKFYGIPGREDSQAPKNPVKPVSQMLSLEDFLI